MNGFSLAVVISASIPVLISISPWFAIFFKKYGDTIMKSVIKMFSFLLIVLFCSFSYYKKKFDFEMHKRRLRSKNFAKIKYNKRYVNTLF